MPTKPEMNGQSTPKQMDAGQGQWGKEYPVLADWLCSSTWSDGTPMGKTRLSMWRSGTEVIVALQLADLGGVRCEARGEHPVKALRNLEALLSGPQVPWQVDPYPIGGGGKRKK